MTIVMETSGRKTSLKKAILTAEDKRYEIRHGNCKNTTEHCG